MQNAKCKMKKKGNADNRIPMTRLRKATAGKAR
jgi:hypothetical protein